MILSAVQSGPGPAAVGAGKAPRCSRIIHELKRRFLGPSCGLLLALFHVTAVQAAEPTTEPLLRLETGMHTAEVFRIATDRLGRWAVTGSDDKTARVWDVADARQLAVLRPPQGPGNEGKVFAVAMSPDGSVVAVAGWNRAGSQVGHNIFLFDRASARLLRRIQGLPDVIHHLSFSPDGRWLAASFGRASVLRTSHGISLFDAASGAELGRDAGYGAFSDSHDFSRDGQRLVTASFDGQLRLYAVDAGRLRLLKAARPAGGERPRTVQFSPDGRSIALAFEERSVVQVLDAETLAEQARPSTSGISAGNLFSLAWSADGNSLLAGGRWATGGFNQVRLWSAGDWSRFSDQSIARGAIVNLHALPAAAGGGWLFVAFGPSWGVLDAQARVLHRKDAAIADLRGPPGTFQLSADARLVRFGYQPRDPDGRAYDLGARRLLDSGLSAGPPPQPLLSVRTEAPGLAVTDWQSREDPKLNGQPLPLNAFEKARSLAISADATRFVLGTDWTLRLFDRQGKTLWVHQAPDLAWAVQISADNRFVVAGYADGTIRWHRMADGKEILAFFPHADRERWVAWTPEGYFDASPAADDLIGYHLNRGADREGEFVSARQLWETFYQPGLIARRLDVDGERLLAEQVQRRGDVRSLLSAGSIPELVMESPIEAQSEGRYALAVRIRNPGQGVGRLVVRVDGAAELAGRWNAPALTPGSVATMSVEMAAGLHQLTVELVDGRGVASKAVSAKVMVRQPPSSAGATLHVLAVGVTKYRDEALARGVAFAAADARAVDAALERGARGMYAQVRARVLSDAQATRDGIEAAGRELAAAAGPDDTVVIYLAGHGVTADGDYHFLPWETRYSNFDALIEQGLSAERLRQMLAAITARKVLVLLDTCSAGRFSLVKGRAIDDKASIDRLQRVSGRAMIAAAADEQMALEGEGQHGVFTFVLLRALEGAADKNEDGVVSVGEIADYIDAQVPAITQRKWGYEQFPMMETRGSAFALVRRTQ